MGMLLSAVMQIIDKNTFFDQYTYIILIRKIFPLHALWHVLFTKYSLELIENIISYVESTTPPRRRAKVFFYRRKKR